MKKILSFVLVLVLVFSLAGLVACNNDTNNGENNGENNTPAEKTYSVAIAVDSAVAANGKVSNTVLVLVIDEANKIVAARFDCSEVTPALDDAGAVVAVESVKTKVEQGDAYTGMAAGSWAKQTKAFEDYIVGKTADEVANLDMALVAGCTMQSTPATFKALVAKAFASTLKVTFKTADAITVGAAISTSVAAGKNDTAKVTADFAGTVVAGGKVVATVIDSCEQSFTITEGALVAGDLAVSKNEQGDNYVMPAGPWYKQAQAYANSTVGKTTAELADLETVSDALAAAGCTMQSTPAGYKATIIKAANAAR